MINLLPKPNFDVISDLLNVYQKEKKKIYKNTEPKNRWWRFAAVQQNTSIANTASWGPPYGPPQCRDMKSRIRSAGLGLPPNSVAKWNVLLNKWNISWWKRLLLNKIFANKNWFADRNTMSAPHPCIFFLNFLNSKGKSDDSKLLGSFLCWIFFLSVGGVLIGGWDPIPTSESTAAVRFMFFSRRPNDPIITKF